MKRGIVVDDTNWFKASDFTSEGRALTIDKVALESIDEYKTKLVVYFKGEEKSLVLNEINQKTIARNIGCEDTDDWSGHQIVPYQTTIKMRGEVVPCIRIKMVVGTELNT